MNSRQSVLFVLSISVFLLIGFSFFSEAKACEEMVNLDHGGHSSEKSHKPKRKIAQASKSKKVSKLAKGSHNGAPSRVRIIDTGSKTASASPDDFPLPEIANESAASRPAQKKAQRKHINDDPIMSDDELMNTMDPEL